MSKAVVLLSGGLDSATAGAMAKEEGRELYGLTIYYGQRSTKKEADASYEVGQALGVQEHTFVAYELPWGGSSLIDPEQDIPIDETDGIPTTYVPARNSILLALAMSYAEAIQAGAIFIGVNAVDYSGYPDCRPEYILEMGDALNLGTKQGVEGSHIRIEAPLMYLTKTEIITLGLALKVDYSKTWSCYEGGDHPCGICDSCTIRDKAFTDLGIEDPSWS